LAKTTAVVISQAAAAPAALAPITFKTGSDHLRTARITPRIENNDGGKQSSERIDCTHNSRQLD
jgi:hypothetical protein